jgi:hypothetical protein
VARGDQRAQASPVGDARGGGGPAGGHGGLGVRPEGVCSGDAREPHYWPRARSRAAEGGSGRQGRGGGTLRRVVMRVQRASARVCTGADALF